MRIMKKYFWPFPASIGPLEGVQQLNPSLCSLIASSLLLLLFSSSPTGIELVFDHLLCDNIGLPTKILFVNYPVVVNNECHHAGRPVFRRIGHESKSIGHFPVYDVTLRATWAVFSLTSQNAKIVTLVGSRNARLALGVALCNCCRHQRSDGALWCPVRSFPIEAVVLPFITEDFLGILVVLGGVVFLLRRHEFLANANGRYFVLANSPVQNLLLARLRVEVPRISMVHERNR